MHLFSEYIRNLSIFLLFMSFVSIVAPSENYKKYINLIAGFILMFIMINPIVSLASLDFSTVNFDFTEFEPATIDIAPALEQGIYELLEAEGFQVQNVTVRTNGTDISRIDIRLFRDQAFFRIEIIDETRREIPEHFLEIKNLISNFYNVNERHIFISYS
ncbi:MAG: stage III sporulation protein AF [Defluviitaleaceae bacterium]|nr:stage III sporulation protein AF [Defluviitaleaceae bacterium]